MTKPLRLDGYVRVSKVGGREGEGFISPDVQADAVTGWAERHGHAIMLHEPELDVSGGTMKRPVFDRILDRIKSGESDGFVVYKVDRFARSLLGGLTVLEEVAKAGGVFASVNDNVDMTTPQGRAFLQMQLVFAELFRGQVTEAWKVAESSAISRGVHTTIPYGYRRGNGNGKAHHKGGNRGAPLVPDEPAATVVRRIYAERVAGRGVAAIADGLNADGIPSPRGGQWTRQTVRAIVKVRTYLGEARKGDAELVDAHEPLVTREDWAKSQPNGNPAKVRGDGTLLSGLIRCAGCGYVMGSSDNGRGMRRYNCNRHHATGRCPLPTSAPAERVEELVETLFLERHSASLKQADAADPAVVAAAARRDKREREYVRWRDDADMADTLGRDDYRAGLVARKAALDEATAEYDAAARRTAASTLAVPADYLDWPMPDRRALLKRALDRVEVRRAISTHEPLADRVELRWVA